MHEILDQPEYNTPKIINLFNKYLVLVIITILISKVVKLFWANYSNVLSITYLNILYYLEYFINTILACIIFFDMKNLKLIKWKILILTLISSLTGICFFLIYYFIILSKNPLAKNMESHDS